MKNKWGREWYKIILIFQIMENQNGLIDLTGNELQETCGGLFPKLIIMMFVPTYETLKGIFDGFTDGYQRATQS